MATFQVELKRVVDDSYPIEIGFDLMDHLVEDMKNGLLGGKQKLAVITDSEVEKRYAEPIAQKLEEAGFTVNIFHFLTCLQLMALKPLARIFIVLINTVGLRS